MRWVMGKSRERIGEIVYGIVLAIDSGRFFGNDRSDFLGVTFATGIKQLFGYLGFGSAFLSAEGDKERVSGEFFPTFSSPLIALSKEGEEGKCMVRNSRVEEVNRTKKKKAVEC